MKPTIGRIVHYRAHHDCGGETYAGIITRVSADPTDTKVDLVTFGPNSIYHNHNVPFQEEGAFGCWSWPPRV